MDSYSSLFHVLEKHSVQAHNELKISYGSVDDQLEPVAGRTDADKWLGLIIHHIVYNGASMTPAKPAPATITFPIVKSAGHENMEFYVKISANGTAEATAKAGIKKQSGTYRHSFWFSVLDASDNTLWLSHNDGMTLTIGAALDSWGRPSYVGKELTKTYMIPVASLDGATKIAVFMRQDKAGSGSILDQIDDFVKKVKRLDDAYKELKNTQFAKDFVMISLAN